MQTQSDLTYHYDGSFEGLLCCVFESYEKKEIPTYITNPSTAHQQLFQGKTILTDAAKSARVLSSIPKKLGPSALYFLQLAFLTSLTQKEVAMVHFLRLGFHHGPTVMDMLTNETVNKLHKAVRHLKRESHHFKGFLRFSIVNNALVAEMEPKNFVLPLLASHFSDRYREEQFFIHDKTHGVGLVYKPYQWAVVPVDSFEMPPVDEEEKKYRELWQLFYNTIAIKGRLNPKARMSHMPMRYWKYMTEFSSHGRANYSREIVKSQKEGTGIDEPQPAKSLSAPALF